MIDLVLPYVDGNDPIWAAQYADICRQHCMWHQPERFRPWDTLRYVLRGVAKCMPFIRTVHLVVAGESQVPNWVNRETVNVVLHRDIIPERYLPTYNSCTIEMFVHRILGLADHFIYTNDDIFPVSPMQKSDFYYGDLPRVSAHLNAMPNSPTFYFMQLLNVTSYAYSWKGKNRPNGKVLKSDHGMQPMRKSTWERLWVQHTATIAGSCTTFREVSNLNQDLANFTEWLDGAPPSSRSTAMYNPEHGDIGTLNDYLTSDMIDAVCVNDNRYVDYRSMRVKVADLLQTKYPEKCKYEKI